MMIESQKLTVLYARLSQDDGNAGDSNSIINQRQILEDFAKRNQLTNCQFFSDDGISGTTFERPAFKEAIELVNAGKVATFIVKDLSRFGRDYLKVGAFTEVVFPEKDVRFIAINNNIDSEKQEDNSLAPFINLFNEWYARDCSKKIKAVKHMKGNRGEAIGGTLPYGYKKAPNYRENKTWLVDEEAAAVVKRIFREYKSGSSLRMIRDGLVKDKILIPSKHKEQRGLDSKRVSSSPYWWNVDVIGNILTNLAYTGALVNFKTYKKNYKSKKCLPNPRENWKIFPDHHAAIINTETFRLVQKMRQHEKRQHTKSGKIGLFTNLVFCADCGHKHYFSGAKEHYYCSGYNSRLRKVCDNSHLIKEDVLKLIVLTDVRKLLFFAKNRENELVAELREKFEIETSHQLANDKKVLAGYEKRLEQLAAIFGNLYEDKVSEKISDEQFQSLSTRFEAEKAELTEKARKIRENLTQAKDKAEDISRFLTLVKRYVEPRELTAEIVRELIEKIEIGKPQGGSKNRTQDVKIIYRLIGEINEKERKKQGL